MVVACACVIAGWVAAGRERISYAGLQIAFAFFYSVFQGYALYTDLDNVRDPVVGIRFGLIVTAFGFSLHLAPARSDRTMSGNGEISMRLGVAVLLGSVLGLNRLLHGKPAGMRTHGLVSLGAAVAAILSLGPPDAARSLDINAISRVLQGILTGIGFLGAGVILRDSSGHVAGLTTAASIWLCAVLGIACGLGYWSVVGIAFGLTLLLLAVGAPIEYIAGRLLKQRIRQFSERFKSEE